MPTTTTVDLCGFDVVPAPLPLVSFAGKQWLSVSSREDFWMEFQRLNRHSGVLPGRKNWFAGGWVGPLLEMPHHQVELASRVIPEEARHVTYSVMGPIVEGTETMWSIALHYTLPDGLEPPHE